MLLVIGEFTRDHDGLRLLVHKDRFFWLSNVVKNNKLVTAASSYEGRIVVPHSVVSLKFE